MIRHRHRSGHIVPRNNSGDLDPLESHQVVENDRTATLERHTSENRDYIRFFDMSEASWRNNSPGFVDTTFAKFLTNGILNRCRSFHKLGQDCSGIFREESCQNATLCGETPDLRLVQHC